MIEILDFYKILRIFKSPLNKADIFRGCILQIWSILPIFTLSIPMITIQVGYDISTKKLQQIFEIPFWC